MDPHPPKSPIDAFIDAVRPDLKKDAPLTDWAGRMRDTDGERPQQVIYPWPSSTSNDYIVELRIRQWIARMGDPAKDPLRPPPKPPQP
jgi:hypothetical protein